MSGAFAYLQSPYQNLLGGKTGTAEVFGHQDTSWLASWGPVYKSKGSNVRAKFVLVGMVEQASTGAKAAGPMLKRIWDGLFGIGGQPIIAGTAPATKPPHIAPQVSVSTSNAPTPNKPQAQGPPVTGPDAVPTWRARAGGTR